jgi:peptidoglycan hydrolase-like protein with peptidoglycan-binding domain
LYALLGVPANRRSGHTSWAVRLGSVLKITAVVLVLGALAVAAVFGVARFWPAVKIQSDGRALARVKLAPIGVQLSFVRVTLGTRRIPVAVRHGRIWPLEKVHPGARLLVVVVATRASWAGGATKVTKTWVTAPRVRLAANLLHPSSGAPVQLRFTDPVVRVHVNNPSAGVLRRSFYNPRLKVGLGVDASGGDVSGTVLVRAAARTWESLSLPAQVSWFPAGTTPAAIVKPAPGSEVTPATPIELTLSEPVSVLFGKELPQLKPNVNGSWQTVGSNRLVFTPTGTGYALGTKLRVSLPRELAVSGAGALRVLHWDIPTGTTLRLQQLLAQLGYLPVDWNAVGADVPRTLQAQTAAALAPPRGHFVWRFDAPPQLQALWAPGQYTTMTQAALMAFEHQHGLTVDGLPGPTVWSALLAAVIQDKPNTFGYTYVLVHRTVPQHLILWHNGKVVLTTLVNTGVPGAPTPYGTHAVFEHIPSGTMSGTNPDGTHYHDPGIPWISYFYGGEAIHGFDRGSYGFPQSVGCVETPIPVAGKIWPYTPIGTLVTIAP